jgi:hypothetical protein
MDIGLTAQEEDELWPTYYMYHRIIMNVARPDDEKQHAYQWVVDFKARYPDAYDGFYFRVRTE